MSYYNVSLYVTRCHDAPVVTLCVVFQTRFEHISIDDVTSVYLQQRQGIGLSIHVNELLHYSMAHYRACVSAGIFFFKRYIP